MLTHIDFYVNRIILEKYRNARIIAVKNRTFAITKILYGGYAVTMLFAF